MGDSRSRSAEEWGDLPTCRAGLCAGAGVRYPTGPGIVFESEYNIPELPASFGPDTTLTDYLCVRALVPTTSSPPDRPRLRTPQPP